MSEILLVEDSRAVSKIVRKRLQQALDVGVHAVSSLAEAKELLEKDDVDLCLGLLDLHLPDAPDGEILEYVSSKNIPSIVFTGTFNDAVRDRVMAMRVIDYIVKDSPASLSYLVSLTKRIYRNRRTKVLVVDDSSTARMYLGDLLRAYQFNVLTAENGVEALKVVGENPDIRLVVTDYNMPEMDGFELIKELRKIYDKERMAIIGVSGQSENQLSVKFIKIGANDFLTKPFLEEEFFCRISQNMDNLDQLEELRDAATKDFLTKLYNRRYFFDKAEQMFASAGRKSTPLAVGMTDVDFFKKVNDTYGHDAGDAVLKVVAGILNEHARLNDLPARFGGEEFCILVPDLEPDAVRDYFEELRERIEAAVIEVPGHTIRITTSIGVCPVQRDSLEQMLTDADAMLYEAKEGGRNRVVLAD